MASEGRLPMASIHEDKRTGNWIVMFRFGGKQFRRSCETASKSDAVSTKARVEDTIRLLNLGRISIPPDADPGVWIMSEGKLTEKPKLPKHELRRLDEICTAYIADQIGKAKNTIACEEIHVRHLKRLLGESTHLSAITLATIQGYINTRSKTKCRDKLLSGRTIRKELATFRQIWDWARKRQYVAAECPLYDEGRRWAVTLPKPMEKEKFQTWEQIKRRIARGGSTPQKKKELWDSLFLDEYQIAELLKHVKEHASYPFIYPMFVFAAYTGARRGEIRRSHIDDFDFESGQVTLRERKRKKEMAESVRFVPLHPKLAEVIREWFKIHPGGSYTIAGPLRMRGRKEKTEFVEMTPDEANHHFKFTLEDSKWKVLRGFHVLRHSFGSNLARSGKVPRDTIAKWMGHTTEEMKDHYQHLFPQDGQSQINVLK
jgi:integrase